MCIKKGKIMGFRGSWMSGLGALLIEDEAGVVVSVPCENAPMVRALEGAFGGVIADNHSVDPQGGHIGQEIYYSMDEMGLVLQAFTPVSEASQEMIDEYNRGEEEDEDCRHATDRDVC